MSNIRIASRSSFFVLVLLAARCGYWGRRPIDQPTAVESKAPVWIWSGGEVMKWHMVFITRDSVSGIPYEEFESYRSCRRSIPRSRVDSMKVAYRTFPQSAFLTLGVVSAALVAEAAVCAVLGGSSDC